MNTFLSALNAPVVSGMPNTLIGDLRLCCSSSSMRSCKREFSYFYWAIMASRDFRLACNLTNVFCSSWMASLVCLCAARNIFFRTVWTSGSLRAVTRLLLNSSIIDFSLPLLSLVDIYSHSQFILKSPEELRNQCWKYLRLDMHHWLNPDMLYNTHTVSDFPPGKS